MPIDLRHLRTFVATVDQGTVSGAALRLRIAQPALSRQIHDLEEELGIKLFNRARRRLALTNEGEQLLDDCRAVLRSVERVRERSHQLRLGDSGVLRVAATPQTIDGVFSTFLHRYAERRPGVQIRLREALGTSHTSMLERGEAHVAVTLVQPSHIENPSLERFDLAPLDLLAASRTSLKGGTAGGIDITRLAEHPLLLLDSSSNVRTTFDAACRLARIKPDIFIESRTPHALLALAEAGHGVAVVPSVLPTRRYRLRLARIIHAGKPLREAYAVLWDKRHALPPYARDFCESLAEYVRRVFPISRPSAPTARERGMVKRRATG